MSAVTFAIAIEFVNKSGIVYNEFMTLLLVVLEVPAIAIGILLARFSNTEKNTDIKSLFREVFFGKSIFLLIGGLIIGYSAGTFNNLAIKIYSLICSKDFLLSFYLKWE